MCPVLVEQFHGLLELIHEDMIFHFEAGQEHDDLSVEVCDTISRAADNSKVVLGAFELSHRVSDLDLPLHRLILEHEHSLVAGQADLIGRAEAQLEVLIDHLAQTA